MILGLLNTVSDDAYKAALNQLLPELYSDAEISALYASLGFSNSLLSCKVNGTDTAAIIREGQCLWAGANARFLDSGTTFDQIGFNETAGLFTAGAQVALDNVWRLGFAGGFQTSTLDTATNAQSQGSLGQGGVALKYNPGPLLIAGTLSGGGGQYDTKRPMSFGGFTGLAEGDQIVGLLQRRHARRLRVRRAAPLLEAHARYEPHLPPPRGRRRERRQRCGPCDCEPGPDCVHARPHAGSGHRVVARRRHARASDAARRAPSGTPTTISPSTRPSKVRRPASAPSPSTPSSTT